MLSLPSNDSAGADPGVMMAIAARPAGRSRLHRMARLPRWLAGRQHRGDHPLRGVLAAQIPPVAVRLRRDWNAVRALIERTP